MEKQKTKCNICGTKESKHWMMCLGGWTLCDSCSKDYQDFKSQPENDQNVVILMEVYFRRGKGEKISYEQLHKEKSNYNFLMFKDLFKESNGGKFFYSRP
ncbi:MAG: hypothetical protein Q8N63_03125 [Nanoarchaeota archaeon]|nr:hypothetical protein [Nanoarchaeota archaeon]